MTVSPHSIRYVIVDTDGGVDDAVALLYLLHYTSLSDSSIKLLAITTVFGNVTVQQATININNVLNVLTSFNTKDIKIHVGAEYAINKSKYDGITWEGHGTNGLGDVDFSNLRNSETYMNHVDTTMNAADALIYYVNQCYENKQLLDLILIGPHTNIALAINKQPDLLHKVNSVHTMFGSSLGKGNATMTAEFNVYCDPVACDTVLKSQYCTAGKFYMYDWDLCLKAEYDWSMYHQLCNTYKDTVCSKFIQDTHAVMHTYCTSVDMKYRPTDLYAVACYVHNDIVLSQQQNYSEIELQGKLTVGMTCIDWYKQQGDKQLNITLVTDIDKHLLYQHLVDCLRPEDFPALSSHRIQTIVDKYNTELQQLKSRIKHLQLNDTLQLEILQRCDITDTVDLVMHNFITYEPMNSILATRGVLSRHKNYATGHAVDLYDVTIAQTQHMSLNIKHNNDIIASIISHLHVPGTVEPAHNEKHGTMYIGHLIQELEREYEPLHNDTVRILRIPLLNVVYEYNGAGLATLLVRAIIEIATIAGYDQIVTDATTGSQDVFHKLGFVSVAHIPFDTFEYDSLKPFVGITTFSKMSPTPSIHLMVYTINKNKSQ